MVHVKHRAANGTARDMDPVSGQQARPENAILQNNPMH
jgi:hypothetical protein